MRRGQSMVEMALIMPLFFLLVLGIVEFSWYVYTYSELDNAVRRGSEWASKSPPYTPNSRDDNSTDLCARLIKDEVLEGVFMHDLTYNNVTIVLVKPLREIGVPIEVRVNYSGPWLTPLGNYLFKDGMSFNFRSRRTIVNTAPPEGMKDGCTT
jgi:hypothetical protein